MYCFFKLLNEIAQKHSGIRQVVNSAGKS